MDVNSGLCFLSIPPLTHAKIISQALNENLNVFTEINLVNDDYDKNMELANKNDLILFLSSTQLYRKEINYIHKRIQEYDEKTSYIYHIGNYLPDWHPWESYKNFFVGNKKTNGIREILAIELPWIIKVFSKVSYVHVSKAKYTALDIDYPDNFIITLEHENGDKGALIIDLVSRKPVRNLEVIGEQKYLSWDGKPTGLEDFDIENQQPVNINLYDDIDTQENYNETVIENAYYEEIKEFFECIDSRKSSKHSFKEDEYVLSVIDVIESLDDNNSYKW